MEHDGNSVMTRKWSQELVEAGVLRGTRRSGQIWRLILRRRVLIRGTHAQAQTQTDTDTDTDTVVDAERGSTSKAWSSQIWSDCRRAGDTRASGKRQTADCREARNACS